MLFTQKCNYVCGHLSNCSVCYVKFCVCMRELMRIFMFSLLTFTIYSFQSYFIRYLWLLGRQIGIFFRHSCICLKNQREEITRLCALSAAIWSHVLLIFWTQSECEEPLNDLRGVTLRKHSHLIISLRICPPCEITSCCPYLWFSSSIGLAGIKACSSTVLCPEMGWAVLWALLLLGYVMGITRKAWNTKVSELTKSICIGIALHSS